MCTVSDAAAVTLRNLLVGLMSVCATSTHNEPRDHVRSSRLYVLPPVTALASHLHRWVQHFGGAWAAPHQVSATPSLAYLCLEATAPM